MRTYDTTTPQERAFLVGAEWKRTRPLLPVEQSLDELERLQGMGPQTVERFGPALLEILRDG